MKKVIHVIGGGEFGGAERHILDLLSQLPGHDIQAKVVCFYEADLSKALRERGVEVEVLQYGRFDFRLLRGLRQLYLRERPDVVHTHGVKANFFGRLAARSMKGVKRITTVHSVLRHDYSRVAYYFASAMEKMTRRWNHHYIAVSHAIKNDLVEDGVPDHEISVVHHGIDTDLFSPEPSVSQADAQGEQASAPVRQRLREQWEVPQDAFVIGVVGRLVPIKGIEFALCALYAIAAEQPNTYMAIVGNGPELASLQRLVKELKLSERVRFLGFRNDIHDCMRALDCFVSASLSEGLGLNVLEAMSTQVPVVVTGVGGILDFTEHNVNGLLVQPKSVEAIAKHVRSIMTDRLLAERLAHTARKQVVEKYSLYHMGAATAAVYERLLEGRHQRLKKLVISGYYGFGNNGDEAVLCAILQSLAAQSQQEGFQIKPIVLSIRPEATTRMHGVDAVHRLNPWGIIRAIRQSDGLISGGGSLLQDSTGIRTIPYYLSIIKLAQWLRKPTFIYSQGFGPVRHSFFYPLIRNAFRQCKMISVRDEMSLQLIDKIGMKRPNVTLAADPVMGMSLEKVKSSADSHPRETLEIGVAIRMWHPKKHDLNQLAEGLRGILDARPKARLRFLPFHPPKDTEASRYVMNRLGSGYQHRMALYERNDDPKQMLELVQGCDLMLGMRLHSLIYAAICSIPMLGVAYDPKIDHFLRQLGMKPTGTTADLDPRLMTAQALELLDNKMHWAQEKSHLLEELREKSQLPAQQICQYLRIVKRMSS